MNPYRNPSILDNHADVRGSVPMGDLFLESGLLADLQRVDFRLLGSTALEPERMRFVELAHAGRFRDRLRTHFAVFHYRLDNVFAAAEPEWTLRDSVATLQVSNRNVGQTRGRGLEFGARLDVAPSLHLFGHHSYQKLTGMLDTQATGGGTPHHKTTVGFAFDRDRFLLDAAGHRVGPTNWNRNQLIGVGPGLEEVGAYTLVNLRAGYALPGALQGWQLELHVFNLFDNEHHEVLPTASTVEFGQSGEIIRSRRSVRLTYAF